MENIKYTEVNKESSTHTEIKIGTHINIYTNFVAEQYAGVKATRRYLKVNEPLTTVKTEIPKKLPIETMQECIDAIEMSEYECIAGNLKNMVAYIKLKELIKLQQ
tara:strand:- start:1546 stop:1860 length:315 start_codon:yes stop_codon:yes gene_type:complete